MMVIILIVVGGFFSFVKSRNQLLNNRRSYPDPNDYSSRNVHLQAQPARQQNNLRMIRNFKTILLPKDAYGNTTI